MFQPNASEPYNYVPVSPSNPLPVTGGGQANVGGYDSGPVAVSATPNNSSHAAGSAVGCSPSTCTGSQGAVYSLAVARTNGGSGGLTSVTVRSSGGFTGGYTVYAWSKFPANTTCEDQTAFSPSATDNAYLIVAPFVLSTAVSSGTTAAYGQQSGVYWSYKNADTSAGKNVYVCLVANATDTADEGAAVQVTTSGPQD